MPVAVTENVAVCPEVIDWLAGCAVMEGAVSTVNVAALLVTLPTASVTVTVNCAPLLAVVSAASRGRTRGSGKARALLSMDPAIRLFRERFREAPTG